MPDDNATSTATGGAMPAVPAVAAMPAASPYRFGPPLLRAALLVLSVFILFLVADRWEAWSGSAAVQRTDDAFLQTDITPLATKVSGFVAEAPAGDFAAVKQGQLLIALVSSDFDAQLAQQEAGISAASAALAHIASQVEVQQANILAGRAIVDNASAALARSRTEAARQGRLASEGAGSAQAQDIADTAQLQGTAQLEQSRAQLLGAQRQLAVLAAQRQQAEASLAGARAGYRLASLNVGYTRIVAPSDGVTGQRQVRIGQFVAAGQQVSLVAALPNMWVLANFKETQIHRMRIGQPCDIRVDAFPEVKLSGRVVGFAPGTGSQFALLPPDNATGNFTKVVQRIGVKIALDDLGQLRGLVRPGLSVTASVRTAEQP